jgi:hypothetical protein
VIAQIEERRTRAKEQITETLRSLQTENLSQCWPDRPSGAPPVGIGYSMTFDRNGNETSRAVRPQTIDGVPPEVVNCLRHVKIPAFHVEPADQYLNVDAQVSYQ